MKIAYEYHHSLSLNYQIELKFINTFKGVLMKTSKIYCLVIYFTVCICISPNLYADRAGSIRALFTWAEANYSNLFMPSPAAIQNAPPWTYVYYPETNTYIVVDDKDLVWVLGDVFGGLLYIDTLEAMLKKIGYIEADTPLNPELLNGFVPLIPHPTTPNVFLIKQETSWVKLEYGLDYSSVKQIKLYPDGSGIISWFGDFIGVVSSGIYPSEAGFKVLGYMDEIYYDLRFRENKEYIVTKKTGKRTLVEITDLSTNRTSTSVINIDPGPVIKSLLFNDRKSLSYQFASGEPEELFLVGESSR